MLRKRKMDAAAMLLKRKKAQHGTVFISELTHDSELDHLFDDDKENENEKTPLKALAVSVDGMSVRDTVNALYARGYNPTDVEVLCLCDSCDLKAINDVDLGIVATFTNLRELTLYSLKGISSLDPLRWFKKLVILDISRCPYITTYEPLKDIRTLHQLTLIDVPHHVRGMEHITLPISDVVW